MITLFPHQTETVDHTEKSWSLGYRNVLAVLPTGAGKTLVKAEFAKRAQLNGELSITFAHRDVLLGQISDALCLMGVRHTFIASKSTVRDITNENFLKYGDSFYDETSIVVVASVDAFLAKLKKPNAIFTNFCNMVKLWQLDETHHLLRDNKWGQCVQALPNARGLGVTATPLRADGKGLGRGEHIGYYDPEEIRDENGFVIGYEEPKPKWSNTGLFDDMYVGSTFEELIQRNRLSPYKIYTPPSRLDTSDMNITSSGDYNQRELAKRTDNKEITGDAVEHYKRIANGLQAITYCVNIAHSEHVAAQFNKAGIPSKALSSKTPIRERQQAVKEFKEGRILNLVNADLFGEGFDVPACSVGIMLRKTQSYSLFKQQFGRPLRVADNKPYGIIIDHVNNVRDMMVKYNLQYPHDDPQWSLEPAKKRRTNGDDSTLPPTRMCPECAHFYIVSSDTVKCPECGHVETPAEALDVTKEFQAAEGTLIEMNVDFINSILNERKKVDKPVEQLRHEMRGAPAVARNSAAVNHTKRQFAQGQLREIIQQWCIDMVLNNPTWDKETVHREFEVEFGVNILKAQVLSERLTLELLEKIQNEYA